MRLLLSADAAAAASGGGLIMVIYIVIIVAFMYFVMIRPQKIDITDDTVIVEFGSNKNCRIPMQKSAIAQIEKAETE